MFVIMPDSYKLTIVVPVYNEEDSLPKFKMEMDKYLKVTPVESKVLFINDGSEDSSLELIKKICCENDHYTYVALNKNYGVSTVFKTGIDSCDTPYFGYIDADLQTTPLDFLIYFEFLDKYQMINGIRDKRNDSLIKILSSKVANMFRRIMIKDGIKDTCCPLKIIDSRIAKELPFFNGMHRFVPALVQLKGGTVKQVKVSHYKRLAGKSKFNLFNRLAGPFLDTLIFIWMRKNNIFYQIAESDLKDNAVYRISESNLQNE
jgi:dolichol-phosphate mannosyltransferase